MLLHGLLRVGYACNNSCTFCRTAGQRHVAVPAAAVERALDEAAAMALDGVVFSGGEPTMRRELPRWIARARRAGLWCGLVTNGRVLSHQPALDRLVGAGLDAVTISLHGPPAVHDAVTRAAAFGETAAAVQHAARRGLATTVVCVVTTANLEHLGAVVDLAASWRGVTLLFSLAEPEGAAARDDAAVVPAVGAAAAAVAAAIARGRARADAAGPRFAHAGLPLCLLPGLEHDFVDRRTEGLVLAWSGADAAGVAGGWAALDAAVRVYPPPCAGCPWPGRCPGVHRDHLARDGVPALRPPPPTPRANSLTYQPERDLGPWADACPVVERPGPWWDRGRAVLLAHEARLLLCMADTRDFPDAEIARLKCDLGQIYLDVSQKAAPDDFAADLRQLRPSPRCAACPTRDRCGGCHEPATEDVFTRDDRQVRAVVAALRGRVLDVGCGGDARYADVLEPLVRAGTVEYLGIDPDPAAVAALRARGWARAEQGTLEELPGGRDGTPAGAAGTWDHLLLLRAFNHLHDVPCALAAAARALRPGGQLVVVENVAFGLVRLQPPPPATGASPRHEHYRNAASDEAIPLIEPHGFRLVEHQPVHPGGSDQWLARFERI